ncbi:2-oxoacid dehydrogenases acyltransferase-domain-containing protein [Aspergillus transmontanensis]|uniref:Dihydrolipoamide acetyltransferase component of pyruvate dehydrogenase complex n=1 Tax=Aspergillus transmontanensis TaxID=1034304 RepID=A0A5N6WE49_9EURO|nr:2-oxoacid dehydrogenases acyltransferase-domain-containing protein [Aspergillus transmontanensis]
MSILRCNGGLSWALRSCQSRRFLPITRSPSTISFPRRTFHAAPALWGVKSQILKDVGEGITEVQIIQWYVEEGAHIEEWKPLCQYQSDKAVDDITSRYEGIVKKLHFQADDTVPTGRALCDIEVEDGKYPEDNPPPEPAPAPAQPSPAPAQAEIKQPSVEVAATTQKPEAPKNGSRYATLATPAVRGMLKAHNVNILDIPGTGKDGRVLKEDVLRFVTVRDSAPTSQPTTPTIPTTPVSQQTDTAVNLTPIQSQMFKTMTRSLNIPHFLFADELNINNITALRKKLANDPKDPRRITFLSFVIKAVSLALNEYPILNAKVDTSNPDKPQLIMRPRHNIGVAMDTPQGLIVPNVKDVANRSIEDVAAEISRLSALGKEGKLTPADLSGGTITVSNIGNIGGTYVAPVIVSNEVAILGVGKSKTVPIFDEAGQVTKGELVNFSWSADHRVVDGATMARMANKVRECIESPELMLLKLR